MTGNKTAFVLEKPALANQTGTVKLTDYILILLPIAAWIIFWSAHQFLGNKGPLLKGQYLDRFMLISLAIYVILFGIACWNPQIKAKLREKAPLITVVFLLLLVWDLVTLKFSLLPQPYFPSPGAVLAALVTDWKLLGISTLHSLRLLGLGYFIGLLVGLPTGIFMGWYPGFDYWATPIVRFIGPIPATAWIPVAMAIFPTSFTASVFIIALATWFPVSIMTSSGIANVNKSYYEVARTLGGKEFFLIFRVAVPAAIPNIFVGLFMGLGVSFITLVVGELLGVKAGLGWYIQWAQGWAEYVKVYAALIVMAVIFSSIITLLFRVRNRVLGWQKGLIKW